MTPRFNVPMVLRLSLLVRVYMRICVCVFVRESRREIEVSQCVCTYMCERVLHWRTSCCIFSCSRGCLAWCVCVCVCVCAGER